MNEQEKAVQKHGCREIETVLMQRIDSAGTEAFFQAANILPTTNPASHRQNARILSLFLFISVVSAVSQPFFTLLFTQIPSIKVTPHIFSSLNSSVCYSNAVLTSGSRSDRRSSPLACGSGWSQSGNKCFKLIPDANTWSVLNMNCTYQGGRLASITSAPENEAVKRIAAGREIYIGGLSYQRGPWNWADNTPFGAYRNWATGSEPAPTPARPCIKMNPSGQWFNNCCRTPPAAGICSKSA